jgi:hypothetical protein
MSEKDPVQSDRASGGESVTGENTEKITADRSAEEYAKDLVAVSAESKRYRQKASALNQELEDARKRLSELEEGKLREQGEYRKMYEDLKSKFDQESEQRKRDRAAFAYKTVTSQFMAEAAKMGCVKPDDLIKLASSDGLISDLEVSEEDFSVSQESLKAALDTAQKRYAYLYTKSTPNIRDGVPQTKTGQTSAQDFSKMKMEDLLALAQKL